MGETVPSQKGVQMDICIRMKNLFYHNSKMILFLLDDTDHLYPQFWQVRIDTFQICHMIPADVVTRLHANAIDLFRMTKPFFFFSRARRRAAYLCIKKKRVSNLHHRSPTLGQNG